jgi:hypothetical protein
MRKISVIAIFCLALWAFLAGGAGGVDYCVDPAGGTGVTHTDLNAALEAAKANGQADLIKVVQGVYTGNFNFNSSEAYGLTLVGGYTAGCAERVADPSLTILDGLVTDMTLYLYNYGGGDITVQGFTVRNGGNTAQGGGIFAWSSNLTGDSGDVTIENNIIMRNSATTSGGGVWAQSSSSSDTAGVVRLINNIFAENQADQDGGGVWARSTSPSGTAGSVIMTNNTITANYAGDEGGGVSVNLGGSGGTIDVYNNIMWGNTASSGWDIYLTGSGTAYGYNNDYSSISGSWTSGHDINNIHVDPKFIDASHLDFRLQSGSPCKDAGDGSAPDIPDYDFEGDARTIGTVDIGADEVSIVTTCVSDAEGLQTALDDADGNGMDDVIMVEQGFYNRTTGNFTYIASESITLLGGYDSGCTSRAIDPAGTVLQGDGTDMVLYLNSGGSDSRVDGFTIQGGAASGSGGGIAAVASAGSDPAGDITIANTIVTGNTAGYVGGGVFATSYTTAGGAAGDVTLVNNIITGNTATGTAAGGGVFATSYTQFGGAAGMVTLTNNTITGNDATDDGGGVYLYISGSSGGIVNAYNNIVWGNTASGDGDDIYLTMGSGSAYGYNNDYDLDPGGMYGSWTDSDNNIDADPLFVNAGAGNYHLRSNSACIDAGTNDALALPLTDFEDDQRMIDGDDDDIPFADIGADEAIVLFAENAYRLCPNGLGFGEVATGSTRNMNLVMNNTTDANINVSTVTTPAGPYSKPSDNCSGVTLHPGDTCSITIQFAPTSTGTFYGSFQIPTNDPEAGTITVSLSGIGITGTLSESRGTSVPGPGATVIPDVTVAGTGDVTPASSPVVEDPDGAPESPSLDTGTSRTSPAPIVISSLPPDSQSMRENKLLLVEEQPFDSIIFGEVKVGASDQLRITFSHAEGGALQMGDIILPSAPYWIVENTCSGTELCAGKGCTVTVQFAPLSAQNFYDYFLIPTDDPEVGTLRINLEGIGVSE